MDIKHSEDKIVISSIDEQDRTYVNILYEAMNIYADRKKEYGGGFRRYGIYGACFLIKDRSNRLWDAIRLRGHIQERDALDVINYGAIALISSRENNFGGEFWPIEDDDNV